MLKTTFEISKMDCPSEENLIRMKLADVEGIKQLDFDLPNRILFVFHQREVETISQKLSELKLGEKVIGSTEADLSEITEDKNQFKLLWSVLVINFGFFVIEMFTGLISNSMGLVADSLDMLADSFVYSISLIAIGKTATKKKQVATMAGYFQLLLAAIGFIEVIRRFLGNEEMPDFQMMIGISLFALIANAVCLYLLQKSKSKESHMKASMIFTSNDVIINLGVIIAGGLVLWLESSLPDLIIGTLVFFLVIQGALRILKLGK